MYPALNAFDSSRGHFCNSFPYFLSGWPLISLVITCATAKFIIHYCLFHYPILHGLVICTCVFSHGPDTNGPTLTFCLNCFWISALLRFDELTLIESALHPFQVVVKTWVICWAGPLQVDVQGAGRRQGSKRCRVELDKLDIGWQEVQMISQTFWSTRRVFVRIAQIYAFTCKQPWLSLAIQDRSIGSWNCRGFQDVQFSAQKIFASNSFCQCFIFGSTWWADSNSS